MQPQPQPTSHQANLHPLYLRNRHDANPIRHGCRQRHHHPGEPAHVRLDLNTPAHDSRNQPQLQCRTHTLRASHEIHKALSPWQLEHGGKVRCNNFSHFGWSNRKKEQARERKPCRAQGEKRPRLTKQNELGSYLISAALACVEKGGRRNEIPMCSSKKACGGEKDGEGEGKRGHMGYQYLLYSSQFFFFFKFYFLVVPFRL